MSVMITDLDIVKDHLDISRTDSGEDNRLQQMLNEVEELIFAQTGRDADLYSSRSYTEFFSGGGRTMIFGRHRPLTSITSLHVDPTGYYGKGTSSPFAAASIWTEGVDYVAPREDESEQNRAMVRAIHRLFPDDLGNVKLIFVAGYASLPLDLEFAIVQLLALIRTGAEKGAILEGETFGKYAYRALKSGGEQTTAQTRGIIGNVSTTLSRYRNVPI